MTDIFHYCYKLKRVRKKKGRKQGRRLRQIMEWEKREQEIKT
jgi:hypothetical protein